MFSSCAPSLPIPITANGKGGAAPKRVGDHAVGDGRDRLPGLARRELPSGRARDGFDELRLRVGGRRAEQRARQREDPLGIGDQEVGRERAGGGEVGEPPSGMRVGGERVGGGTRSPRLRDPLQPDQRRIGVGRQRERRRHHREHVREDLAEPGRPDTSRWKASNARDGCANPSPPRSSSVASRSRPGVG